MKPNSLPIFSEVNLAAPLPQGWPLLWLGFRPFYIGGALLAAVIVPLWVAIFLGWLPLTPASQLLPWHAHEMLFGVAVAIMVGFLMTAGKVWTGFATPRGPTLATLALLWLAARLASLVGPYGVYVVLDMALLPLVAAILCSAVSACPQLPQFAAQVDSSAAGRCQSGVPSVGMLSDSQYGSLGLCQQSAIFLM
jgi:uncharacterized protein involved in response to NO